MKVGPSSTSAESFSSVEKPVWLFSCEIDLKVVLSAVIARVPLRGEKNEQMPELPLGKARRKRAGLLSTVLVFLVHRPKIDDFV